MNILYKSVVKASVHQWIYCINLLPYTLCAGNFWSTLNLERSFFQMLKALSERLSCRRGWTWTVPNEPAHPSLQSNSTAWRWSFRGASMWLGGNGQSWPGSSICLKPRYVCIVLYRWALKILSFHRICFLWKKENCGTQNTLWVLLFSIPNIRRNIW